MTANQYYILKQPSGGAVLELVCTIASGSLQVTGTELYTDVGCSGSPGPYTLVSTDELNTSQTSCTIQFDTASSTSGWTYTVKCTDYNGVQEGSSITVTANPSLGNDQDLKFTVYATPSSGSRLALDPVIRLKHSGMLASGTPTIGVGS